jgi:integrase
MQLFIRNGYYHCSIKNPTGGPRIRRTTGIPSQFKEKARLKASQIELEIWEKWRPGIEKEDHHSFEEMMILYGEVCPHSHLWNIRTLARFFVGCAAQLSPVDIANYKRHREGVKDGTIRRELSVLSSAINYVRLEHDWKIDNPVEKRKPKPSPPRVRWITPEEARKLFLAAQSISDYLHWFIVVGLSTGLRKQEILTIKDKVIHDNRLIFEAEQQKGKRTSSIPLGVVAQHAIYDFTVKDVKGVFKRACKIAGIKDFRPHDLRHTFASWMVQRGVPLIEVKDLLRHKSVSQTEIYAHLDPNRNAHYMHDAIYRPGQGLLIIDKIVANQVLKQPKLVEPSGIEPLTSTLPVRVVK